MIENDWVSVSRTSVEDVSSITEVLSDGMTVSVSDAVLVKLVNG